jgi:hypothetical protein
LVNNSEPPSKGRVCLPTSYLTKSEVVPDLNGLGQKAGPANPGSCSSSLRCSVFPGRLWGGRRARRALQLERSKLFLGKIARVAVKKLQMSEGSLKSSQGHLAGLSNYQLQAT